MANTITIKEKTMHHKHKEHLEQIKENIAKLNLSEDEKSNAWKHIEEWYAEDNTWGSLLGDLSKISPEIEALLVEMGLI